MLGNPKKMVFESTNDVVDYVSKGMIPSRKNFEKVMLRIRRPDTTHEEGQVYIPEHLFINCDNETLNSTLERIYANRVRNRNITIGVIGGIAAVLLFGGMSSKKNKKDYDFDDIDDLDDIHELLISSNMDVHSI